MVVGGNNASWGNMTVMLVFLLLGNYYLSKCWEIIVVGYNYVDETNTLGHVKQFIQKAQQSILM